MAEQNFPDQREYKHVSAGRHRATALWCGGLLALLGVWLAGCGDVQKQATAQPRPTTMVSPTTYPPLGITRYALEQAFREAGFPPFTGHGDAELVSSVQPDGMGGLIIVRIYGPAADIDAVELSMTLSDDMAVASVAALTLLDATSPDWAGRDAWLDGALVTLEQRLEAVGDDDKVYAVVGRHGDRVYSLRFPVAGSLFLSVQGTVDSPPERKEGRE